MDEVIKFKKFAYVSASHSIQRHRRQCIWCTVSPPGAPYTEVWSATIAATFS
jgi:hypothetical protein